MSKFPFINKLTEFSFIEINIKQISKILKQIAFRKCLMLYIKDSDVKILKLKFLKDFMSKFPLINKLTEFSFIEINIKQISEILTQRAFRKCIMLYI